MNKLGDPADAWNTREEPVEEWVARWNPKGAYMLHHFDNGISSHVVRMGRMCTYHKSTLRKLLSSATCARLPHELMCLIAEFLPNLFVHRFNQAKYQMLALPSRHFTMYWVNDETKPIPLHPPTACVSFGWTSSTVLTHELWTESQVSLLLAQIHRNHRDITKIIFTTSFNQPLPPSGVVNTLTFSQPRRTTNPPAVEVHEPGLVEVHEPGFVLQNDSMLNLFV